MREKFVIVINCLLLVTCVILQNKGSGFHAASSVIWDSKTDGKSSLYIKERVRVERKY